MDFTRRALIALPLAITAIPTLATAKPPIIGRTEPYVNPDGFVYKLNGDHALPVGRACKVLAIGEWNGYCFPVVVQGWFEEKHIVPDYDLEDITDTSWKEAYYALNDLHWERYDRALVPNRYIRALRNMPPPNNPHMPVETFLLDSTGKTWPKAYKWVNGRPVYV